MIFAAGLVCGLALAFMFIREAERRAARPEAAGNHAVRPRIPSLTLRSPPKPVSAPASERTGAGKVLPASEHGTEAANVAAAPHQPVATSGIPSARTTPSPAPRKTEIVRAPEPSTILTRLTTRLKLQGELRGSFNARTNVEFELYVSPVRTGGSVDGLVRLIQDEDTVEVRRVAGSWFRHTMTLGEIKENRHGVPEPAVARQFVLEFPETAESEEITGIWRHGALNGKLILKSVPVL